MVEITNYLINLVLVFYIYAFIGWCIEVLLKYRQYGRFINRGFLTGPWLPIYGAGSAIITISVDSLSRYQSSIGNTYVISFIVCGFIEYMASYIMERRFHARWWDYSQRPMNLQGRIWIGNLILFGIGGVGIIHIVNPVIYMILDGLNPFSKEVVALVLSLIFISDYTMSHFVLKLVKIGVESSEADNTEEIRKDVQLLLSDRNIFYKRFVDAYPDVIYRTERVKERMDRIKAETEKKIEELNKQWVDNKEQISASVKAGTEQLINNMEPTISIKNTLIDKQQELIEILYDEKNASEKQKEIMDEIEKARLRIERRNW